MNCRRVVIALVIATAGVGLQPAWAQWVVTDPTTTARNTVTAVLKDRLLQTLTLQQERLRRMAARLSALTSLAKYAVDEVPRLELAIDRIPLPGLRPVDGLDVLQGAAGERARVGGRRRRSLIACAKGSPRNSPIRSGGSLPRAARAGRIVPGHLGPATE